MGRESARVLVVDDDEVVLVAISDLLERQGYRVYTQISPIGATQVIVRQRIDAAVIDVNLPEMQGDSVVRLIRSWDRLKDLPIIMVSGASTSRLDQIKRDLPGIQIVPKATMHRDLGRVLFEALAVAPRKGSPSSRSSSGDNERGSDGARDMLSLFVDELASAVSFAGDVWLQVGTGQMDRVAQLSTVLRGVQRRAQLLNMEAVSQVLAYILDVLVLVKPGVRPPPRVQRNINGAIAALAEIRRPRDLTGTGSAAILQLATLARELRSGSSGVEP